MWWFYIGSVFGVLSNLAIILLRKRYLDVSFNCNTCADPEGGTGPDPSSHFLTAPLEMVASTTSQIYVNDILSSYKVGKIY